ncbi:MAG: hypothetical protein JXA30_02235 [Deltaproteobacteria bacterium]|nr:hypothetical protein [Deltaproteobacteria bacterium]
METKLLYGRNIRLQYRSACLLLAGLLFYSCQTKSTDLDVPAPAAEAPTSSEESTSKKTSTITKSVNVDPRCLRICGHVSELNCGTESVCVQGCSYMVNIPKCTPQMNAFIDCVSKESVDHFECGEQGIPSIKEGYCNEEQARFAECYGSL